MLHSELLRRNGREREREMMAWAARQRLARQLRDRAKGSRQASRSPAPAGLTWPEVAGRESVP